MKKTALLFLFIGATLLSSCNQKSNESENDNPYDFREYISYTTNNLNSVVDPIRIELRKSLDQFESTQEIDTKYISISPKTKGTLRVKNGRNLIFKPKEKLKPDTEYTVSVKLGNLYSDVPSKFKSYTFSFKTYKPNFKINLGNLQSYNKNRQFLKGNLESADFIESEKLSQLLQVTQNGKTLPIKWDTLHSNSNFYPFIIDSIHRQKNDSKIHISWEGKPIDSETHGENDYTIPGLNNFKVVKLETQPAPKASLSINFSDPLDSNQDFSGLVKIEKINDLSFEVDGNVLYVYPDRRVTGDVEVTVFQGIKNTHGFKLKKEFSDLVSFQQLKPAVSLISKGVILPRAKSTPLYFKAVNLSAVDVRIIKIYKDNILQFLQSNDLKNTDVYNTRRVGRRVAKKTIHLGVDEEDKGYWKAYALKLSDFFKADPGALYRVELSFKKDYSTYRCEGENSFQKQENTHFTENLENNDQDQREEQYWNNQIYNWRTTHYDWEHRDNPCYEVYYQPRHFVLTNLMGSDLGLIVKKGTNKTYRFFTTNLINTKSESGVEIKLYDYQQQLIKTIHTGETGSVSFKNEKPVAFVIAQKGDNYAYAKLDDGSSLSISKFDVSGKKLPKGLKGFLYTERGVHRPGDTIHLTFVLNDKDNPLPDNVPVKLEVNNARGKLVQRTILSEKSVGHSSQKGRVKKGFYYFPIPTKNSDPTGNWRAEISVGGVKFHKILKVAAVKPNRLKIKLDFDDKILDVTKPITGLLTSSWLQGAPARNLKVEMEMTLTSNGASFENYKQYNFVDPVRDFNETEIPILKTQLSAAGKARFSKKIALDKKAPSMLQATFLTKVFENGGDFSIDVFSKKLAPYDHFVGLKAPKPHRYDSFYTDEDNTFDIVTLDAQGEASPDRKLSVQVFKIEWRWWWNRGRDHLSEYKDATVHKPYKDFEITSDAKGKAQFVINVPKEHRGRYLIRIKDEKSGHATGMTTYFYRNWGQNRDKAHADNAKMLVFSVDKDAYKVGETAKITFPSGSEGHALVSVENGTEVLLDKWVETEKGKTQIELPITPEMAPNVYINISLLQPHERVKNDLPIRLYGVIPIQVEDPNTILKPQINMPDVLKPKEDFKIEISEKNKREMTYTIAVVDEGLLDLTRFQTPDIHGAFYSLQALGVKTFDLYDDVIGAYSGSVNNIYEIGGDHFAKGAKKHKANRFKPVVEYLGPFHLKPGENRIHHLQMPNYIGSVRTMVVAGNKKEAAYGNAEETTPVRKPLMVLASLPRKLSPGETVTLPVTVFTMGDKVKNAKINIETTDAFEAIDGNSKTIHFDQPGDQLVNFRYKMKPTDKVQKVTVNVIGNGEKASYEVEIDVINPNPITHTLTDYKIEKEQTKSIHYQPYGVAGTNKVKLELSTLPPMDFTKRLQYLIHYPHGCVEQTTSAAFPQLYLADIFDLTKQRKAEMVKNVKATLQRLGDAQMSNGAMPFWPGENKSNTWTTNYAGHFMLEAKAKGYALPISFLNNWLRYQKYEARHWNIHAYSYNSSLGQAYRLYTLALAGQPELAAMNRLRESDQMSNEAKWRLAGAYALTGKKEVAQKIAATANIDFEPHRYDYYTYGSPFRNEAMALETMVVLGDDAQRDLAVSLAKKMSSDHWMSTQETSFALMAMAKMVHKNGGKGLDLTVTQNGKSIAVKTDRAIAERPLKAYKEDNTIKIVNHKENVVFVSLYQEGKLPLGKEVVQHRNLSLKTQFVGEDDKVLSIAKLHQGTEIKAEMTVTNTSSSFVNDIALTQIFPSGWEIVNTSFTDLQGGTKGNADYTDIRDDRIYFYFDLKAGETKTFSVKLNSSYLGRYYLPGTQAEGMYDHSYDARNKGEWVQIIP